VLGGQARGLRKISLQRRNPSGPKLVLQIGSQEHVGARFSAVSRREIPDRKLTPGTGCWGRVVGGQARALEAPKNLLAQVRRERLEIGTAD